MLCTRVLIYSLLICHIQERMFNYYSKTKVFMAFGPGRCFLSGGLILCQRTSIILYLNRNHHANPD